MLKTQKYNKINIKKFIYSTQINKKKKFNFSILILINNFSILIFVFKIIYIKLKKKN